MTASSDPRQRRTSAMTHAEMVKFRMAKFRALAKAEQEAEPPPSLTVAQSALLRRLLAADRDRSQQKDKGEPK